MYTLTVWKNHRIIETYTTEKIDMLRAYYNENWKWSEYNGDCFCDVVINGVSLGIEEIIEVLEG